MHNNKIIPNFRCKWNGERTIQKEISLRYEKLQTIESFHEPLNVEKKEDFFSTLKQSYSDDEEITRTNTICEKYNITNGKKTNIVISENDVLLLRYISKL